MNFLDFDREQLQRDFNSRAFSFTHRLHASPLFDLARLAQLAEFLERKSGTRDVHNAAAATGVSQAFGANGTRGTTSACAIDAIESSRSWVILKRIEQHPDYRGLVQACLRQLAHAVPELEPQRIRQAEGFIFITSPHGVTPYHIDPQWSFLAQIRGRKTYRIYDVQDPDVISEEELENYYCGETMAARYLAAKEGKAEAFELAPGVAVNQPLHAPHSAEVGEEYSISFTLAVISDAWAWRGPAYRANRVLRNIGIKPQPVGADSVANRVKGGLYRSYARLRLEARKALA